MIKKHLKRIKLSAIMAFVLIATPYTNAQTNYKKQLNSAEINKALHKLNTVTSVLYIAAHPDDENTRLIAYLANHLNVRTGYLSMTRGDGGQNLIGAEKGALMGVIRTQELLEARKIDGGEQFFTRANDFGYSKTPEETMEIWGKDSVLADMVLTIRRFKPDIMITRFPADGRGGHGHHTASAILADEAFDLAADPNYNPWSIKVPTHKVKRLMVNVSSWWNPNIEEDAKKDDKYITLDVGEYDPVLGKSYMEIASESRSMHKSQGFGSGKSRGTATEYLYHLKGEQPTDNYLFSGINTTWSRVTNGSLIVERMEKIFKAYNPENPKLIVPFLLQIYEVMSGIEDKEYWARIKKEELTDVLLACTGIWVEATSADYSYSYGDNVKVTAEAILRSTFPVVLNKIEVGTSDSMVKDTLKYNQPLDFSADMKAPSQPTTPYWLINEDYFGRYHVSDVNLIGTPQNQSPLTVKYYFSILGVPITITEPVVHRWVDRVDGELYRPIVIAPAITMNIQNSVYLFTTEEEKEVKVKLKAFKDGVVGSLFVELPEGWTYTAENLQTKVNTPFIPVVFYKKGEEKDIVIKVKPAEGSNGGEIKLKVRVQENGVEAFRSLGFTEIKYPHIQPQVVFSEAKAKLMSVSLKTTDKRIGYIMGAGDDVPENLREIGYRVELINPEDLTVAELSKYDVIIGGIRAYNTRDNLMANNQKLLDFVKNGGTYIVQYNTSGRWEDLKNIGPYPFSISRDRVTKETAEPTLLKSELLNVPNKIEPSDFDNWVQERGLYFANDWDKKYSTAIEWSDPGEDKSAGALIMAEYGKGVFIYTGISFFRQLPAGVPGAFKLMVNLIEVN